MQKRQKFQWGMLLSILCGFLLLGPVAAYADESDQFLAAVQRDNASRVKELLNRGVDPNTTDENGQCALFLALQMQATKVADVLIAHEGTDVNYVNPNDETPLMMAAIKGLLPQAQALIYRQAQVNKLEWTPLHYAASQNNPALIQLMIDYNALVDAPSPNGTTPLMMATRYGSVECVKLLLAEGANPLLKNQLGYTAYDFAREADYSDRAELLLKAMRERQPAGW